MLILLVLMNIYSNKTIFVECQGGKDMKIIGQRICVLLLVLVLPFALVAGTLSYTYQDDSENFGGGGTPY